MFNEGEEFSIDEIRTATGIGYKLYYVFEYVVQLFCSGGSYLLYHTV